MFINLIERIHEASDIETHENIYVERVIETHSDRKHSEKILKRFRTMRLDGISEGRELKIVHTAKHPNDPLYTQNRAQRRWHAKLMRRLLKRARNPKQEQVDEEVNKFFDTRRESGLVVPKK